MKQMMKAWFVKACVALAAAVMTAFPSLAGDLPVAGVIKLDDAGLALWRSTPAPIVDMGKAVSSGTISSGYNYVCDFVADVGYVFQADVEQVTHEYDNWYCDYTVSFDNPIAKDSMGLVGKYPSWGSLGFFAPLEIPANFKIPLLNTVMRVNGWTYADIRSNVGTFTCGAFNLAETNNETTMTVELRLFAPTLSTADICDTSKWIETGDNKNTFVITNITYKLVGKGILPSGEGHGPLACAGIADKDNSIPKDMFYLSDNGSFVKADASVEVKQKTAYFSEFTTVAKIGNVYYATLAKAMEAAADGDTIVLTENVAETFTATTAKAFTIDPNGKQFAASNVTAKEGCELVPNALSGAYEYRMQVTIKEEVEKIVVKTDVPDETDTAAVQVTEANIAQIFNGAKSLEIVASGVGTVTFNQEATKKIGENIAEVIKEAGGETAGATVKTTVTVAIADAKEEKIGPTVPQVIVKEEKELEVVKAISVTAVMKTIIQQQGAEQKTTTIEEVYNDAKKAGLTTVTVPYSGINPTVWYIDTDSTPWTTNAMTTVYNAEAQELSFDVYHFSLYVVSDEAIRAVVGKKNFITLQEAFDFVATDTTEGTEIRLVNDDCVLTETATLAEGVTATLDLGERTIRWADGVSDKSKGLIANNGMLTLTDGTLDAGAENIFTTASAGAKTSITDGKYFGLFPDATGLSANAGPILVSGGAFANQQVPDAFCATGWIVETEKVNGAYHVKSADIYIRNVKAAQRYPWNGFVDITCDVRWSPEETAKTANVFVTALDNGTKASPVSPAVPLTMTTATLYVDGVSKGTVDCVEGFPVTATGEAKVRLVWNSTEAGAVPLGTIKERVSFKFVAKPISSK